MPRTTSFTTLLAALLAAAAFTPAGSAWAADPPKPPKPPAPPTVQSNLPPFVAVSNDTAAELDIEIAPTESAELTLRGPQRFLSNLQMYVENGELAIRMKRSVDVDEIGTARIAIRMPNLLRYRLSGLGETTIHNIAGERLEVRLSGAGSLDLKGEIGRLELVLSGVGNVDAKTLTAREADVRLSGVGSADVRATERLDATVTGVGSLTYWGEPANVQRKVSGVGSIKRGD